MEAHIVDAVNWILKETEANCEFGINQIMWHLCKKEQEALLKKHDLGVTSKAKCASVASSLFKEAYVGLHGTKEIICLVVVDTKGKWHFIDANNKEIGQKIEELFSSFFDKKHYKNKENKL